MKHIMYAIDKSLSIVISQCVIDGHSQGYCIPVINFADMSPEDNFQITYHLETFDRVQWKDYRWTKKLPVEWKNVHREYWGMKLLPMTSLEKLSFERLKNVVCVPPKVKI